MNSYIRDVHLCQMKKIAILFLVTAVLLQCSMKVAIVAYYQINKDYIASNLCVNKEKPKMQCNGKCYLSKKIKAQEDQEQKLPSVLKGLDEITLFCSHYTISFSPVIHVISNLLNQKYILKYYNSPLVGIFQPPQ